MPTTVAQKKKLKRQPNGEGTPETLPSGLIRYKGRWNGQTVYGSAQKTSKDAKSSYRAKLRDLKNPKPKPEPEMPTVADYMWKVLDGPWRLRLRSKTLAPSTWQMGEQIYRLNIIGSEFGAMTLGQVVPSDLESWGAQLVTQRRVTKTKVFPPRPMGNSTKRRYMGMLESIFEYARVQDEIIPMNPGRNAKKPAEDEVDYRTLSGPEVEELLELCDKEDPDETDLEHEKKRRVFSNRRRRRICLLGLHGFGPAESGGMRYEDSDGDGLNPKRQIQRLRELGVIERDQLKTKARRGWVAVDDELKAILAEQKEGWILGNANGGPMEPGHIRRSFQGMVKGTKFEGMSPYDLRHTFAQRLLDEGVDVKTAAELMRHSVEVFLKRYVRSDRARKMEAIKRLRKGKAAA